MAGTKNNRRTLYTRKVIREAFLDLLKENELGKITVTQICQLADINRGTFYQYYKDPADLFKQIEDELIEEVLPVIQIGKTDFFDLAEWLTRLILLLKENQIIAVPLLQNFSNSRLIETVFDEVHDLAINAFQQMYQEEDPQLLEYYFIYFVKGVLGTILEWIENNDSTSAADLGQLLARVLPSKPDTKRG